MRLECIPIWLEVNERGEANAFALNTSFAIGRGATSAIALEQLEADLAATRKWLVSHHVQGAGPHDLPFRVVQSIETDCRPLQCESKAFFDWDAQLLSNEEIDHAEMVLHCSRADLLSLTTPASNETLDIRLAPKSRTIREIVRHVTNQELWLATCMHDDPLSAPMIHEFGNDLHRRMRNVRLYFQDEFLNRARRTGAAQLMRQQLHNRELWTMRKALRSAVQHEIYHLKQVYRMLTRIRRLPSKVRKAAVA